MGPGRMGSIMGAIFLSASVPVKGRGNYYEDADPFLIQFAVRELLVVALGRRLIVWGGHPAITPMVWSVCEDLGVQYGESVLLFQSRYFEDQFPEENARFKNVRYVDAVDNDECKSLELLRRTMLEQDFEAGVFIGGMEGVEHEYQLFSEMHPRVRTLLVDAPGGAARQLACDSKVATNRIDFLHLYAEHLEIDLTRPRNARADSGTSPGRKR